MHPKIVSRSDVLDFLVEVENSLPDTTVDIEFPGRKIVFRIALDDRWNHEALERYMSTTGRKAVYLPRNIEHLAKNNGLQFGATEVLEKLTGSRWVIRATCFIVISADKQCWYKSDVDSR